MMKKIRNKNTPVMAKCPIYIGTLRRDGGLSIDELNSDCPMGQIQGNYSALPMQPKISILVLTISLMACAPGASSLRGSKPLPCWSLPASM